MLKLFIAVTLISVCCYADKYAVNFGPLVKATKGEVWPKPQREEKFNNFFIVHPHKFFFKPPDTIGCPNFLNSALKRYWNIIANSGSLERRGRFLERSLKKGKKLRSDKNYIGILSSLKIELAGECENENILPKLEENENYSLAIKETEPTLSAYTIFGVLRGLETFSQLIYLEDDTLIINSTIIDDSPRFPHRGLLLDTARHFQPLYIIFQLLDAMSYNKLNVFHWHITDDQSFPYKSKTYPELSDKGAYHPISRVYEQSDILKVIEYARLRGIRVIPEFDTPGHTNSWGASHPELLTQCFSSGKPNGVLGPLDPSRSNTFQFVTNLFTEVVSVFPDNFFHIGGDEVDYACWKSNPNITAFMKSENITKYEALESYFIQKVINVMDSLKTRYLVWEEVFLNGAQLSNSTIVHVWRDDGFLTVDAVTKAGKLAIFSSCWYLDYLKTGGDWQKYYECDPQDFPGTDEQKRLIIGGEACMWAESVNEYNVMPRIWPRASAAAEKLWSNKNVTDIDDASQRLEEHTCRMNFRGIPAQPPNGPGVCL